MSDIEKVLYHTSDKILDFILSNNRINIIGDNEILLFSADIDKTIFEDHIKKQIRKELIVSIDKDFLFRNNLPYF